MTRFRFVSLAALVLLLSGLLAGCSSSSKTSTSTSSGGGVTVTSAAAAGTVVHVTVKDSKATGGPMTMDVAPVSVKAGDVTFDVMNAGTIDHEVVVLKTATPYDKLPVVDAGDPPVPVTAGADKVDESASVGETGSPNLKPGESRSFTIKAMAAGTYVLVCNIAKHYGLGMRAAFTVT